jgi:hypothetical protein
MRGWPLEVRWPALVVAWCAAMVGAAHPHDEPNQAAVIELGQVYEGSIEGATGEALTPYDWASTCDVWHQLTIPGDGLFKIAITSQSFNAGLGVFDPCSMADLASSDGSGGLGLPRIEITATAGTKLLIRVAGYSGATGRYALLASHETCDALSCALMPSPADGAEAVPIGSRLRWGSAETAEKPALRAAASTIRMATIYGSDDRCDEYEVWDPDVLAAGRAVAMIVPPDHLIDNADGTFTLFSGSMAEMHAMRTGRLLCPEERFRDQPAPGTATGFLVAPQILATAGHVVSFPDIYGLHDLVVFDFVMVDANTASMTVRPEQLYGMKKVLAYNDGIPDWALVQLDRPVTGRVPLPLRRQGRVADDADDLLVIGHPLGLPRKYSGGAKVLSNSEAAFFETDPDVNAGNSGSPVLSQSNLQVEGILFSGNEDFVPSAAYQGRCDCSLICPDEHGRCDGWEWISRATCFNSLVPVYDVYLGTDPNALPQVASALNVPWFAPAGLLTNTTYYWQVHAHTVEGVVVSPIWSFRTD